MVERGEVEARLRQLAPLAYPAETGEAPQRILVNGQVNTASIHPSRVIGTLIVLSEGNRLPLPSSPIEPRK